MRLFERRFPLLHYRQLPFLQFLIIRFRENFCLLPVVFRFTDERLDRRAPFLQAAQYRLEEEHIEEDKQDKYLKELNKQRVIELIMFYPFGHAATCDKEHISSTLS